MHIMPSTAWDIATISKMGPIIVVGLLKLRVQRQNPPVGSVPHRANTTSDKVTQRVPIIWHTGDPIEGTQHPYALYLSLGWEVSFKPLRVGWYLTVRVFPPGITQESRLKALGLDLIGGALDPV
jgi:hypothetical protein